MEFQKAVHLPHGEALGAYLNVDATAEAIQHVSTLIEGSLFKPIQDLFHRPCKGVRGKMVELGYRLCAGDFPQAEVAAHCQSLAEVLEAFHAGSLVVDDIQDGSRVRRGQPTLHLKYGVPVALNAGNWLYFWPMLKIEEMGLTPEKELAIYRICHRALFRAHFGQALDVGTPIDTLPQNTVSAVCMASLELKSGALMALALGLGAALADAKPSDCAALVRFGHDFGIALQMFDDIGNFKVRADLPYEVTKRYEDLILKRPSWIWATAAHCFEDREYQEFVRAADHLPDESFLKPWLEIHGLVGLASDRAKKHLDKTLNDLENALSCGEKTSFLELRELGAEVAKAYD